MEQIPETLESDWAYALFGAFREEVVAIAVDFEVRVKRHIDLVVDLQHVHPPSALALLLAVAFESGAFAAHVVRPDPDDGPGGDD